MKLIYFSEGWRILKRSIDVRMNGTYRFRGNAQEICEKAVDRCWNAQHKFFQTSSGHFNQFWTRDFGFCAEALANLGYKGNLISTLKYALGIFSGRNKITTTITPGHYPYDMPKLSADSLPLLVRAVKYTDPNLLAEYESFFLSQINHYFDEVFDKSTCLVRADTYFSSIKDYTKRRSSAYDNCMLAMLKNDLRELDFYNPFSDFDIKSAIEKNLWNGRYFYEDLDRKNIVTGDANVFPFWTGVFDDKKMFNSCLREIKKSRLDRPFPLRYSRFREKTSDTTIYELLAGDYERDTIWAHLGMCFLEALKMFSMKKDLKKYTGQYAKIIEQNSNFLEVFDSHGEPFKTLVYHADEGMLWAGMYLNLAGKNKFL